MMRPELEKLPENLSSLPIDSRGYPVPWFVQWVKNEAGEKVPEFRAMDMKKWARAVKERLCWVCGGKLGANLAFTIGPMCGITRTTSEPPSHLLCAEWSVRNCPFLTRPHMTRRDLEADYPGEIGKVAGVMIPRNPGVSLIWVTRDYRVWKDPTGSGYLITVGAPESVTFWAEGRTATRAEIDASVDSGIPLLEKVATSPADNVELQKQIATFRLLLPTP